MGREYLTCLAESMTSVLKKMTDIDSVWLEAAPVLPSITAGVTVVSLLGFVGARKGRVVMEMSIDTAQHLGQALNQEDLAPFDKMIFYALSELSNIFCGAAVTRINNGPERPGLRLTPPNILVGEGMQVFDAQADLQTARVAWNDGEIFIHLSMERGDR
ncbi:hypothetical protein GTO91_11355 [Heliobacterium undosum]|uniref:Chemotaxis phosphatase CheX-like domain-containing protein n=1 Tax=Heliomicrobium undosum TaxID=121734 RepID=A0A845L1C6_9FIRM|nr:chemotaxis protein CheX [Heliomicrobium undosum]MZP30307.1 hypothetical protein [Heliomicrobium undosum]